jgi:hypothetical protein
MSAGQTEAAAGLSAANIAAAPAWVREGSPELQRDYAMGVEFEELLAQQMTSAMDDTAGLGEGAEGEAEGAAATPGSGVFSSLLSGALSQGVADGGGLGIAAEIARDIQSRSGAGSASSAAQLDGATAAPSTGKAGS